MMSIVIFGDELGIVKMIKEMKYHTVLRGTEVREEGKRYVCTE